MENRKKVVSLITTVSLLFIVWVIASQTIFSSCSDDDNAEPTSSTTPSPTPTSSPAHDIRGIWHYEQSSSGGTYDLGTITFSGDTGSGTYVGSNYYQEEFSGAYSVEGNNVLLSGNKEWTGVFNDENHLSGTWYYDSELCTWAAERQSGSAR